jgi:hypothetical protein
MVAHGRVRGTRFVRRLRFDDPLNDKPVRANGLI